MAGRPDTSPPDTPNQPKVASGRPKGAGHTPFSDAAVPLLENGYTPIPIRPGGKAPAASRWSTVTIDEPRLETWTDQFPNHGIGLRTGHLVGLDIDCLDPDRAYQVTRAACDRLGDTLMRVGLWPKRLLLYRTDQPFPKLKLGDLEVLGAGQQFVAFGVHPDTGTPYYWPDGDTPLDVPLYDLPHVTRGQVQDLLVDCARPQEGRRPSGAPKTARSAGAKALSPSPTRDDTGRVIDGRDGWLSSLAYHVLWDALDDGGPLIVDRLAEVVWQRFKATADLQRPKGGGSGYYGPQDARAKLDDKLRLYGEGRLPERAVPDAGPPPPPPPELDVAAGRVQLAKELTEFCEAVFDWHTNLGSALFWPPRRAIRATVGLGKSAASRTALVDLQRRLKEAEQPHKILFAVPSHALAEEAAAAWLAAGANIAVQRGYERTDPATAQPMCRAIDQVRIAIQAGEPVPSTCCASTDRECDFLPGCLKDRNRDEVAKADVVVLPYDLLFIDNMGVSIDKVGVVVVDEGCWQRAHETSSVTLSELAQTARQNLSAPADGADPDRLQASVQRLLTTLAVASDGPITADALRAANLTAEALTDCAVHLSAALKGTGLRPSAGHGLRKHAKAVAAANARIRTLMTVLRRLADLISSDDACAPDLVLLHPDPVEEEGAEATPPESCLHIGTRKTLNPAFVTTPLLHLDATLRPELAQCVLPAFETSTIEVAAPHMHLTLVQGRFGKRALCPPETAPEDAKRAARRRLQALVTHVRWLARKQAPGRTLVITYKDIEDRFADIPNVEVAHFNAIAGLDCYGDVAQIIVIGRPVPDPFSLAHLTGTLFQHAPSGGYAFANRQVRMRDGSTRSVRCLQHNDPHAETLRCAICDDEHIQCIGRGRGVNRTTATPLQVHVHADVALPLIHDRVTHWEFERPDVFQEMLLAGVASDSPADAAALHPELFKNANQAKLAFQRLNLFKGQTPVYTYKEMTLKSRRHRRARPKQPDALTHSAHAPADMPLHQVCVRPCRVLS